MLINSRGQNIGDGDLGWAPLLAIAAPIAKTVAVAAGGKVLSAIGKKLTGSKPKPPPCTFGQKIGRFFGSKPNCT